MTVIVQAIGYAIERVPRDWRRALVVSLLFGMVVLAAAVRPGFALTTVEVLRDAYLQVAVFVALTLALFTWLEIRVGVDLAALGARHRWLQVPIAASLGAIPGCGGAIIVISYFVNGRIGFPAILAALVATMGDAAFLLLAREPTTALFVFAVCFTSGIVTGYVAELVYQPNPAESAVSLRGADSQALPSLPAWLSRLWMVVLGLSIPLAGLTAFQVELTGFWYQLTLGIGTGGALLCLFTWMVYGGNPAQGFHMLCQPSNANACHQAGDTRTRTIVDTNFVTVWVLVGFIGYALAADVLRVDIGAAFAASAPLLPLLGILIGFVPGCGPQIVVTSLYLAGAVPMSALLGNAVSNDGDALFPAIAMAPRAALIATITTAIPALIVAYTVYFWWE